MKRTRTPLLLAVLSAVAVAAPAAFADGPATPNPAPGNGAETVPAQAKKAAPGKATPAKAEKRAKPALKHHLLWARVSADATATGVEVTVLGGNRDMRRALDEATDLTAKIDADTTIRLVGRAVTKPAPKTKAADDRSEKAQRSDKAKRAVKKPVKGTYADLTAGDLVKVSFRATRGTAAADLPAALRITDFGPARTCKTKPVDGRRGKGYLVKMHVGKRGHCMPAPVAPPAEPTPVS